MPLNPAQLQADLETMLSAPKETTAEATQAWADVVADYALAIVPQSTTQVAAKAAFLLAFAVPSPATFVAALSAFGSALALGMVPTGVPPAVPLNLVVFLEKEDRTYTEAATDLADLIDQWFRTGATIPPTVVKWS